MRKIYYLAMAVMLASMVGCQNDDELLNVQSKVGQTFYATFENGVDTRTALDANNNNNVLWSEGDMISIFRGSSANTSYILNTGKNTTFGEFIPYSFTGGTESGGSTSTLSANVAYYPYDSNVTVSENNGSYTLNATFPVTQTYTQSGTFGNGASPMMAVTSDVDDNNLKFKNVGAIFRLQLKGTAKITKIVFSAEANLAGKVAITASNTSLPTVDVTEGSNAIILDCGENGVSLNNEIFTNFVVAMLPVENVTGGITITIYDNAGKKMVYTHKADETITIERSKAYTTDEVTYSGDQNANTATSVQAALDAAINANTPTTIQLEPGVNYGTLYFRPGDNSRTVDISDVGGDAAGNEKYSKYEDITIIGAPGATVDQFDFQAEWITDISCGSYIDIQNLTVKDVTFSGEMTAFNIDGSKGGWLGIDGLTIDGCTMNDADGADRFVFQQISGHKELNDKSTTQLVMTTGVKNLTINNCTITGAYQVIESRAMEGLTITDNTFNGIKARDMLITVDETHHPGVKYTGTITITGNKSNGGTERFIRANGIGDATLVIKNNTITDYKGADYDYIKVTDHNGVADIENNTCSYTVTTADALKNAVKADSDGAIITLAANTYDGLSFTNPANFNAKNLTIVGEEGTIINGFSINGWSADSNIEIDGLTFKNITFTSGLLLSTKVMANVKVEECKFVSDACIHQNDNTEKLTNLDVIGCEFTGDLSGTTTALMLENTEDVYVYDCTFKDIDFNVLQGGILTGDIIVDNNRVNNTGDRVFRFVTTTGANITISNNTIMSNGDENGELAKASNATEITLTNNTWNGKTDAEVAGKLINITAK